MADRMPDNVTRPPAAGADALLTARPSLLPFDPKDMLGIRVRPAGYAAMCGVSRQSVSQWVKKGWITLGPDGLLDPVMATRQLLAHADPTRFRARLFRDVTATMGELHARIQSLEAEVVAAKRVTALTLHKDDMARRESRFQDAILADLDGFQEAASRGLAEAWLESLSAQYLYELGDAKSIEVWRDAFDSRETYELEEADHEKPE